MIGTDACIASNRIIGVPSVRELKTTASKARSNRPALAMLPCHFTRGITRSRRA